MKHTHTNNLVHSSSPYLLQHAHNPVNWQPWGEEALAEAKKENKLLLVSIGYAACHWCHVMEHESFEDEKVAEMMNRNFVCIKVDREERPDVDNYYMTAVQLMRQSGGWPLNVIALPDGRPVWGGTYFPKDMWMQNLTGVATFHRNDPAQTEQYASQLQNGIQQVSLIVENGDSEIEEDLPEMAVTKWKNNFDLEWGGKKGQPKFPMPVNLEFLLSYGFHNQDKKISDFVELTLQRMAQGGIYDQVGGGFARYSVDEKWIVPHFEKMLYDNGQLLSVYAKGFQQFQNEEFKVVVYETAKFLERELMDGSGAFYSSLDADSEGVEGKFYVWNSSELQEILHDEFEMFAGYYSIEPEAEWEEGNYILWRNKPDEEYAKEKNISVQHLREKVKVWKEKLTKKRANRTRPGLDDKTLVSWNSLATQGLADAYFTFHDEWFLSLALRNAGFIRDSIMQSDGKLFHTWKSGKSAVDGFLEDYVFTVQAFLSLFEATGSADWLNDAQKLQEYAFSNFYNPENGLFFYAEKDNQSVVTNHYQNQDNVIPAANSVMANNLHRLYLILGKPAYLEQAKKMLRLNTKLFSSYPTAYSNWGILLLKLTKPFFEVVVCGRNAQSLIQEMQVDYRPNVIWISATAESTVPILKDRFVKGKNLIYVCREGSCYMPVETKNEALQLLNQPNEKN